MLFCCTVHIRVLYKMRGGDLSTAILCFLFSDPHHGTPMLLEGVRCVGVELEYDSEQSDWQGFD